MASVLVFIGTFNIGEHPGMPSVDYIDNYRPSAVHESKGIYSTTLNLLTGELSNPVLEAEASNPAFLVIHPSNQYLYVVNELDDYEGKESGAVTAYSIQPNKPSHKLQILNQVSSHGSTTCHISLDKAGKHAFLANYMGATVAAYPLQSDGSLSPASAVIHSEGTGPVPSRQASSHPHSINLDPVENVHGFVTDLGTDSIDIYHFNEKDGSLKHSSKIQVQAGSGPRQLVWHPSNKFVYVINELNSTINVYRYENGSLHELAHLDISPPDYTGKKWSAEIKVHPNGKFLYASNRITDSLAIFKIDENGLPNVVGHHPCNGRTPRHFVIDSSGNYLLVANQHSDNITSFKIDIDTGLLTKISEVHVASPACLQFIHKN